eukprot:Tbor_TRINITY_DN197_c0_g1::TRINITY_DN197_c0_g1_i1::g.11991::m.11991
MNPSLKSLPSSESNSPRKKGSNSNSNAKQIAEAAILREKEDRQARIVASTFANMELVMTQQAADSTNTLYAESLVEVARLRKEIEIRDRDALEVVHFLQTDSSEKASQITRLESRLLKTDAQHADEVTKLTSHYEKIIEEKDNAIRQGKEEVQRLTCALDDVAEFRREKIEMQRELQKCRERETSLIENYEQELSRLKFDSTEEKVRLQVLEDDMNARFKEEINQRALHIAKLKNSHVHDLNQQLTIDKEILEQEVCSLVGNATAYQKRLSELQVEMQVKEDIHIEAIKRTSMLSRKIKETQSQKRESIQENQELLLETQMVAKAQQEAAARKIDLLEKQLTDSRRSVMLQQKELIKMKHLAAFILDQRGEMEKFFYKAIRHTKNMQECEERRSIEDLHDPGTTFLTQSEKHEALSSSVGGAIPKTTMARLTGTSQEVMGQHLRQNQIAGSGGSKPLNTLLLSDSANRLSLQETLLSFKQNRGTICQSPRTVPVDRRILGTQSSTSVAEQIVEKARKKEDAMLADAAIRSNYGAALELRSMTRNSNRYTQAQLQDRTILSASLKADKEYLTSTRGENPATTKIVHTTDVDDPLFTGEAFSYLPWNQKEQVIKSLIAHINREFYVKKTMCNEEEIKRITATPAAKDNAENLRSNKTEDDENDYNHLYHNPTTEQHRRAVDEYIDWGGEKNRPSRERVALWPVTRTRVASAISTTSSARFNSILTGVLSPEATTSVDLTPHLPTLNSFSVRPPSGRNPSGKLNDRRIVSPVSTSSVSTTTSISPISSKSSKVPEREDSLKRKKSKKIESVLSGKRGKVSTPVTGSTERILLEPSDHPFEENKKENDSNIYLKNSDDGRWRKGSPKPVV